MLLFAVLVVNLKPIGLYLAEQTAPFGSPCTTFMGHEDRVIDSALYQHTTARQTPPLSGALEAHRPGMLHLFGGRVLDVGWIRGTTAPSKTGGKWFDDVESTFCCFVRDAL